MPGETPLERNLTLEAVRVTEAAAIAAAGTMGLGDERAADQAAVHAMRKALDAFDIDGRVVIGEGEAGEAPVLFIGEKVGSGAGPRLDVACSPLEGTTITAKGLSNALAVIAFGSEDGFLNAPQVYMDKIAVGRELPAGVVDLERSPGENLAAVAEAKGCKVADLVACILDRPRHAQLIAEVREAGARIVLIPDGDIAGVIATAMPETGIDIYLGSGGAPEGVLAAAAMRCIGGQIQGRLLFRNNEERGLAQRLGILDLDAKYGLEELASGDVIFSATGVTDGSMLRGVRSHAGALITHSIVMRAKTGTVRWIEARRRIEDAPRARSRVEDAPRARSRVEDAPRARSRTEDAPRARSRVEDAPRARSRTEDAPRARARR